MGMQELKAEIEKRGIISFVPSGKSMWPFFKSRKQSVIVEKKTERLKKFDVGFYVSKNGALALHRVIKVEKEGYVFSGDSTIREESVKEEKVFGVMKGFYKGKRYIDANDKKYLKKVEKWYSNEEKRRRKVDRYLHRVNIKKRIKNGFKKNND